VTRRFERFWQALEQVPDLAAVPVEWRASLGGDYAAAGRFLLATPRIAASMRSTASGRTCVHEVRRWKGRLLSVCPDGCESAELTRDEVTVHRLDIATLAREVAESLGLEAARAEPVPGMAGVWHVGEYVPYAGLRFPAHLTLTGEPEGLSTAAHGLAARGRPFILLAPTRSAFTPAAADVIRQARACFLPLDELLGYGDDGRLALLDGLDAEGVLAEFRAAHVPQPKADDVIVFFPTPAGARWEDVAITFRDAHTVSVSVGGLQRMLNYTAMGMANRKNRSPNRQWELLYDLAQRNDLLRQSRTDPSKFVSLKDLTNEHAANKLRGHRRDAHRKQKQLLAEALRRFFKIDGDPFILSGQGGWRPRFTLTAEAGGL